MTDYRHWDSHPRFPVDDWKAEVANDKTRLGYWEWVDNKGDEEPRYYIVDIDKSHPAHSHFPDWYGLVDEEQGEVIALFQFNSQAVQTLQALSEFQQPSTPASAGNDQ
jgi:hypothetical protein